MDSLKRAMKWDEEAFGREYDLDLFMIVAVRDFNFGAMENKGLNIFNSSLLLADPATATDVDYERIEGVVAHEYFHNWTGDRITCRDWFQLCLKEGLTVFRDQSFSADMRGHAVQRIKEVKPLRARQFSEDAGPLAHPVRPSSYHQDRQLLHRDHLREGRGGDPHAEDPDRRRRRSAPAWTSISSAGTARPPRWRPSSQCFAEVSGRDLAAFFAWYEQAGTPRGRARGELRRRRARRSTLDAAAGHRADARPAGQAAAADPGRRSACSTRTAGLLRDTEVVVLDCALDATRPPRERGAARRCVSALRGFSAPVNLTTDAPAKDAYVLLAADPDLFNRWEAGQSLARDLILARAAGRAGRGRRGALRRGAGAGAERPVGRAGVQGAAAGACPASPTWRWPSRRPIRPRSTRRARRCARAWRPISATSCGDLHGALQDTGAFSPDAASAGRRALRNAALELLAADPHADNRERARGHYRRRRQHDRRRSAASAR